MPTNLIELDATINGDEGNVWGEPRKAGVKEENAKTPHPNLMSKFKNKITSAADAEKANKTGGVKFNCVGGENKSFMELVVKTLGFPEADDMEDKDTAGKENDVHWPADANEEDHPIKMSYSLMSY